MTRRRALLAARVAFLLAAVGCAWWGFHGRWDEVGRALSAVDPLLLCLATIATATGLLLTSALWRRLLAALGSPVPHRDAAAVFLVGQLGKYIPGSLWSFAAQAQLGRRYDVPPRVSLTASSLFLLVHTSTGVVLGGSLAAAGALGAPGPRWPWALAAAAGAVLVSPPVLRRVGARLAGGPVAFGLRDLAATALLMAGVWTSYGLGLLALAGGVGVDPTAAVGAFALGHAAGVLMVVAPAGLGAREGVLVALLSPTLGLGGAAAAALLSRVVHAVADFGVAAVARLAVRPRAPRPGPSRLQRFVTHPISVPLLLAVMMSAIGLQVAMTFNIPSWGNDEPAHVGYVATLAHGDLPTIYSRIVDDPDRFPHGGEGLYGWDRDHNHIWVANHPPLYHLALVPVWQAFSGDLAHVVLAGRFINTVGFALWLLLVGLVARELVPHRPAVPALATVAAVTPTLAMRAGFFMNDGWASAAALLAFLVTIRMVRDGITPQRVAWATLAGSVAAGTRAPGVLIVAACAATVLLVGWRRVGRWRSLLAAGVIGGVPAAATGWFYLRNLRLYGDLTGQDALLRKFDREPVSGLLDVFAIPGLAEALEITAIPLAALLLLGPLAATAALRRNRWRIDPAWALLCVHGALTAVNLVGFMAAGGGFHDRYFMTLMPLLATVTALGMLQVGRWWRSTSDLEERRDWMLAAGWSVVLLTWLAGALWYLERKYIWVPTYWHPVEGPLPVLCLALAALAGLAVPLTMLAHALALADARLALVEASREDPEGGPQLSADPPLYSA